MCKQFCIFVVLFSLAIAAPTTDTDPMENDDVLQPHNVAVSSTTPIVEILESGASHQVDGSYHFHFHAGDGSFREETAVLKNPGTKSQYLEVNGAYSYIDVNGKEVVVEYVANNRGFVPHGGNIPTSIAEAAKRNSELPPYVEKRADTLPTVVEHNDDVNAIGSAIVDVVPTVPTVETIVAYS